MVLPLCTSATRMAGSVSSTRDKVRYLPKTKSKFRFPLVGALGGFTMSSLTRHSESSLEHLVQGASVAVVMCQEVAVVVVQHRPSGSLSALQRNKRRAESHTSARYDAVKTLFSHLQL